jgi:membrane protein DedA with SNARE-associated domain
MPWWRFFAFNAAGGIVWAIVFGTGAYVLGTQMHNLSQTASIVGGILAVIAIVAFLLFLRRNEERLMAEADAALPELR